MNSILEKIKAQLERLNERERFMVYTAAIALAIFLPYQLIWAPLVNSVEERQKQVEQHERDLVWMQSHLDQIKQLTTASGATSGSGKSLYGIVERTARQKFGGDIRVQQEGKSGIRIQIENSSFDDVMVWLDDLQFRHKIFVKDFKIDSEKVAGRIRASILVES
ncbi:MAG: type II secretion system protein M [Thioalkalispiraceae bacterium]|jgi:general secretion pathway protein M